MNLKLLIPAGLISLLLGLIIYLPAPVAAGWVQSQVPGLRLTGVSGSVFAGRMQYASLNDVTLENVSWQLSPGSLLLGRANVKLKTATDTGHISGDFSRNIFGQTYVQNLNGSASISWLGGFAGYRFLPMDGLLTLHDLDASIKGQKITHGEGKVSLENANWLLIKPAIVFGDFTAAVSSDGETNAIKILNSEGPLKADGGAQLTNNNRYQANLRVRARAGADKRLIKLLTQLGKADAQGWYHISERGSL